ncbi:MAG: ABC transporter permease, partial [Microbacteriaceae bacterium]
MTSTQPELYSPGRSRGLADVFSHRYLLKLLVRKEIKVRYRGSVLGLLWSYVKPAVQFLVYYIALGVFLGLDRGVPNFPIYLFAGIVVVNFFTESIRNSTKSILDNSGLINKIYLPRELFPVASVWVSAIHFFPQVLVLIVGALITGWQPNLYHLGAAILGFVILALFSLGLGLFFGSINVLFRDSENFVELISMVATWASPVLYLGAMVKATLGGTVYFFYQLNPIT